MLGVRPEVGGLKIDPCLPADWTRAKITRRYRGAVYEIEIAKRAGVEKGEVAVELDGERLAENLVPPRGDGKTHAVKVTVS